MAAAQAAVKALYGQDVPEKMVQIPLCQDGS